MRKFSPFLVFFVLCWVTDSEAATWIVKKDGTGDTTTIQEALNQAASGDIVEIGDDGTYVEDVTISPVLAQMGIPAAPLLSFTLQAAEGKHPVIQAANLESSQRMSAIGVPGRDMIGLMIWGCQDAAIQGVEIINLENTVNAFNVQASLVIADSVNVSIQGCTIRGPAAASSGEGAGIIIAGVQAQPFLTDNIAVRDTLVTETHYGIISAVFQKDSGADPNQVTIENCRFLTGFESAIDVDNAREMIIRDCFMDGYNHGIHFAGGNSLVEDCMIINSLQEGLEAQIDTNWNDSIDGGVVRRCAFIANGFSGTYAGVRCTDGPLRFEHCIVAGNAGPGIKVTTGSQSDVSAVFDHCDIYENLGEFEVYIEGGGSQLAELTITNSNIVSTGGGINNEVETEAVTAQYNNVFVKFENYINVNAEHSMSVDPMYVSPSMDASDFSFGDFQLDPQSPVLTAGVGNSAIGSQTEDSVPVLNWHLY